MSIISMVASYNEHSHIQTLSTHILCHFYCISPINLQGRSVNFFSLRSGEEGGGGLWLASKLYRHIEIY